MVENNKLCAWQYWNMSSPENANYNCIECTCKFGTIEELDYHMRKDHNLEVSNE